jgi:hypothetical protein
MCIWLFGGMLAGLAIFGGEFLWILVIIASIGFIIWCIAS